MVYRRHIAHNIFLIFVCKLTFCSLATAYFRHHTSIRLMDNIKLTYAFYLVKTNNYGLH